MSGFKAFLLRGNVVDLAVGIVIGAAFGAVVSELVKDLITPLIAAIAGQPNFDGLYFTVNNSRFLDALISFLIIAAVVYYFVVLSYSRFRSRFEKRGQKPPACQAGRRVPTKSGHRQARQ